GLHCLLLVTRRSYNRSRTAFQFVHCASGRIGTPSHSITPARETDIPRRAPSTNSLVPHAFRDTLTSPAMDNPADPLESLREALRAVHQYHEAIDADPAVADPQLADQLGIGSGDDSDIVEGRLRQATDDAAGAAVELERPKISFRDVGGMETVKDEIRMKIIL